MKILVTGASGFIGSHFVKEVLAETDHSVVAFVRDSDQRNMNRLIIHKNRGTLADTLNRLRIVHGDLLGDISGLTEGCDAVVNFAAKTFVDHSIRDPWPFIESNVVGTYKVLEDARRNGVKRFIQISCYDEKTRVLTQDGFKNWKQVSTTDTVLSLNKDTGNWEHKPITKIIVQDYEGDMVWFRNYGPKVDLKVTPNHRMFIEEKNKEIKVVRADELSNRNSFLLPKGNWIGEDKPITTLVADWDVRTEDLAYLLGVFIGDGCSKRAWHWSRSGLERKEYLKQNKGLDGRFRKVESIGAKKMIEDSWWVHLSIPRADKSRKKVEAIIEKIGLKVREGNKNNGGQLFFTAKGWGWLLEECGHGAKNKRIPKRWLALAPKYLAKLYEGLMDADGYKQRHLTTASQKLTADFVELCLKLGKVPRFDKVVGEAELEGRKICGTAYYTHVGETQKKVLNKNTEVVPYKGKVWCLRVPENGSFVVERGGTIDVSGNTDEVYGAILEGAYKEDARINPTNPYAAAKAGADALVISYAHTFGMWTAITRTENNYGPFQNPQKVFPAFVRALLKNEKLPIYGDGKHRRQWLWVTDHCKAVLKLLTADVEAGQVFHVAGSQELENLELAKKIISAFDIKMTGLIVHANGSWMSRVRFMDDHNIRPGHDRRYALVCDKMNKLGWIPQVGLEEGITEAVKWYCDNAWWLE